MSAPLDLDAVARSSVASSADDDDASGWTPARIAALERLWTAGLSAGQIAGRLGGATRSAVMGKLRRMQLLGRRAAASAPRGAEPPVVPALAPALPSRRPRLPFGPPGEPAPAVETTDVPASARVLAELSPVCCRWPVGPTPPEGRAHLQLFCGEVAHGGRAYCAEHARRAWKTDPAAAARAATARAAETRAAELAIRRRRAAETSFFFRGWDER